MSPVASSYNLKAISQLNYTFTAALHKMSQHLELCRVSLKAIMSGKRKGEKVGVPPLPFLTCKSKMICDAALLLEIVYFSFLSIMSTTECPLVEVANMDG